MMRCTCKSSSQSSNMLLIYRPTCIVLQVRGLLYHPTLVLTGGGSKNGRSLSICVHVPVLPSLSDFSEVPGPICFKLCIKLMRYHGGLMHVKQTLAPCQNVAIMFLSKFNICLSWCIKRLTDSVHIWYIE